MGKEVGRNWEVIIRIYYVRKSILFSIKKKQLTQKEKKITFVSERNKEAIIA